MPFVATVHCEGYGTKPIAAATAHADARCRRAMKADALAINDKLRPFVRLGDALCPAKGSKVARSPPSRRQWVHPPWFLRSVQTHPGLVRGGPLIAAWR